MRTLFLIVGGLLFLVAAVGHGVVRLYLKPKDEDLEGLYYEFEDQHPRYRQYQTWYRITFWGLCVALLLLFLALVF